MSTLFDLCDGFERGRVKFDHAHAACTKIAKAFDRIEAACRALNFREFEMVAIKDV